MRGGVGGKLVKAVLGEVGNNHGKVFMVHLYTYAPPFCGTSQSGRTFIHMLLSLLKYLADPVFDGVGLEFQEQGQCFFFFWGGGSLSCSIPFCLLLFSLYLLSVYGLILWVRDILTDRLLVGLSQSCTADLF